MTTREASIPLLPDVALMPSKSPRVNFRFLSIDPSQ